MTNVIDIKNYAKTKGVTTQAVYKQIANYQKELKEHIFKQSGKRWLDEYAVDFLDKQSGKSAVVVQSIEKDEAVEILKTKYTELLEEKNNLNNEYMQYIKDTTAELQKAKSQLAIAEKSQADLEKERKAEAETHQKAIVAQQNEIDELKEQLKAEQERKLTFKERFFGRKK